MEADYFKKGQIRIFRHNIKNEHIRLTGDILILSDRLVLLASELMRYISNFTDAGVVGLVSYYKDMEKYMDCNIDYLTIVGYLENKETYNDANQLLRNKRKLKIVQWASIDSLIVSLCSEYKIMYKFERTKPVDKFMNYLIVIQNDHDLFMDIFGATYDESQSGQSPMPDKAEFPNPLARLTLFLKSVFPI